MQTANPRTMSPAMLSTSKLHTLCFPWLLATLLLSCLQHHVLAGNPLPQKEEFILCSSAQSNDKDLLPLEASNDTPTNSVIDNESKSEQSFAFDSLFAFDALDLDSTTGNGVPLSPLVADKPNQQVQTNHCLQDGPVEGTKSSPLELNPTELEEAILVHGCDLKAITTHCFPNFDPKQLDSIIQSNPILRDQWNHCREENSQFLYHYYDKSQWVKDSDVDTSEFITDKDKILELSKKIKQSIHGATHELSEADIFASTDPKGPTIQFLMEKIDARFHQMEHRKGRRDHRLPAIQDFHHLLSCRSRSSRSGHYCSYSRPSQQRTHQGE